LGRSALVERAALVAEDNADACRQLALLASGSLPAGAARARAPGGGPPEIVFLFTGQGAQYLGMARGLYESEPVFRAAMDECARGLEAELPLPLLSVVFGEDAEVLDDTAFTQPALFSVEYALAVLWRHWGVEPTAVMGHSVGEYVAACLAGVFTLPDALRLIAARGRLMSRLPRDGGMAAVFADEARVREALAGHEDWVSVAATNGPTNTVIAGRLDALEAVLARLASAGVEGQRLKVSHAFHSPLMVPMLDEFERLVAATPMARPRIGVVSNVTGRLADDALCQPGYWRRHVREAVRFAESLVTLQDDGYRVFLEIGPAPTLIGMAQRGSAREGSHWICSLRKGRDDRVAMLEALAQLQVRGQAVNWLAVLGEGARQRRVVLPTYPFQREHYWHDLGGARSRSRLVRTAAGHPLLGGVLPSALPIFEGEIAAAGTPWLRDHRIFDFTLFPGTGFLELALAAGREALGTPDVEVRSLQLREAMALPDDTPLQTQVIVTPLPDGGRQVQVFSRPAGEDQSVWRLHAQCTITATAAGAAGEVFVPLSDDASEALDVDAYYERLAQQGAQYGPAFRGLTQIRRGVGTEAGRVRGRIDLPASVGASAAGLLLHPALLDACFQLVGAGLVWEGGQGDDLCVPVGLARYRLWQSGATSAWCDAQVSADAEEPGLFRADLQLRADDGALVAELRGLELRRTTRAALERVIGGGANTDWLFETTWPVQPLAGATPAQAVGAWVVMGDEGPLRTALAERLGDAGRSVLTLRPGAAWRLNGDDATVAEADKASWQMALAAASARGNGALA
ncbi:MAG: acyltransferase domain-containing protein, partial [Rhodocyclaceae bacterium]